MKVCVVGNGALGTSIAKAAAQIHEIDHLPGRGLSSIRNDTELVVIAVADPHLAEIGDKLDALSPRAAAFAHCAGRFDATILPETRMTGVMHPMASFRPSRIRDNLRNVTFCIDGDASDTLDEFLLPLGACVVRKPLHGLAYHGAAVTLTSATVAAAHFAEQQWLEQGANEKETRLLLSSLLHSIADNLRELAAKDALSGPFARNDQAALDEYERLFSRPFCDIRQLVDSLLNQENGLNNKKGLADENE